MSARDELHELLNDAGLRDREVDDLLHRYDAEKGTRSTETEAEAEFFLPDRTYQRRRWLFQCLAVAPNPFNGEIRAVGFLYRPGEPATATALDPDDWAHGGWTEAGAS